MLRVDTKIRGDRLMFVISTLHVVVPVSNVDHECYNTLKNIMWYRIKPLVQGGVIG
jgi:hypothetical protein